MPVCVFVPPGDVAGRLLGAPGQWWGPEGRRDGAAAAALQRPLGQRRDDQRLYDSSGQDLPGRSRRTRLRAALWCCRHVAYQKVQQGMYTEV